MKNKIIKIKGMHCASCAISLEKAFVKKTGVQTATVNFATHKANIDYDENKIELSVIENIVVDLGYQVDRDDGGHTDDHHQAEKNLKLKVILSIVLTLPIFLRMFWHWQLPGSWLGIATTSWVQHDLAFLVVFVFGWGFHKSTFKQLKSFRANMDTLISLGTLSAYFYSLYAMFAGTQLYFESAATITSLILLGKYLEHKTKNRASLAMQKLMELGVKKARVIQDEKQVMIEIDQVAVGAILLVKPGEKIPLDGVVIEGESIIDESMLTGESMPVNKKKDSNVFAATINQDGVLHIEVTKTNDQTALAQIIKTVEHAQAFKAPIQKLADKVAGIFVPVVIGIALLTLLGWWLIFGELSTGIINAVAVLIISCPCALGIATPIAVMVGSSVGARRGVLIKDGASFEKAKKIDTVIFDKTGTLTKGEPVVNQVLINEKHNFAKAKIIKLAGSLAVHSTHPLSKAISNLVQAENIELAKLDNFKEISGKGVKGNCVAHKTSLLLGNDKLIAENGLETVWADQVLEANKNNGQTVLFVAHGSEVVGAILLADEIKATAFEAVAKLNQMGLETIIISGDNKNVAKTVADKLKVKQYFAEVLPIDKQKIVAKIQSNGKKVVFVGDGINDAPALVQSDLGIAMGSGTDIARESGNIIIMNSDPLTVVEAIKLSRKTFSIIKQNLFWAFFYNVLAIPLAVAGVASPMIGALAMSLSDIAVIGNSLRIYRGKL